MSRRPAAIRQADVARAIRAAKREGWEVVRVTTATGTTIEIGKGDNPQSSTGQVRPKREVVL